MSEDHPPVAKVTLETIYQRQLEQGTDLAEIKGTLQVMAANANQLQRVANDHEERLRALREDKVSVHVADKLDERVGTLERETLSRRGTVLVTTAVVGIVMAFLTAIGLAVTIGDRLWTG